MTKKKVPVSGDVWFKIWSVDSTMWIKPPVSPTGFRYKSTIYSPGQTTQNLPANWIAV